MEGENKKGPSFYPICKVLLFQNVNWHELKFLGTYIFSKALVYFQSACIFSESACTFSKCLYIFQALVLFFKALVLKFSKCESAAI